MAPADMPFGRVVSATSRAVRACRRARASLPRRTERVWVEGGRSQMATIWTDEAGTGIQALNSGRAGMDYVQNLSRMRPDSSPMRNLTPDAAQREVEAVWRSSTFGKVRGGPQQYLTDEANDWRVRPAGYIPRTTRRSRPAPPAPPLPPATTPSSALPSSFTGPGLPGASVAGRAATLERDGRGPCPRARGASAATPASPRPRRPRRRPLPARLERRWGALHFRANEIIEMSCHEMSWSASLRLTSCLVRAGGEVVGGGGGAAQCEQAFRQQHLDGSGLLRLTTDLRGRDEIHRSSASRTACIGRSSLRRYASWSWLTAAAGSSKVRPPGHGLDSFARLGDTVCAWAQPGGRLGR